MLPLVTFKVAVETPKAGGTVSSGLKMMSTLQDCPADKDVGHWLKKKNLLALPPVPGVSEILSGAAVLPPLVMVRIRTANWSASTSPKLMLVGLTVTPATVRPAVAVLPVPPFAEVTFPVTLVKLPGWVAVTGTLNVQLLFTAMVAPERLMVLPPLVVSVPPHTVVVAFATDSPAGKTSVNATPVRATVFTAGLAMVKPSDVVAFTAMELGAKLLAITGGATTIILAEAATPAPPSLEVITLVVLFWRPAAVPVTFTAKLQELLAGNVAPDRLIALVACVAVIVPPPQAPVRPFGVEITRPAGSASVKPTPVNPVVALGFWMVKLSVVVPFSGMLAAPNALAILGADRTVMLAFEVFPVPPSVELT